MTGPKLNEGALLIPEGAPYTKATAKYLRGSASKARVVLDLIRGLDVRRADEVLQFTTRDAAQDVRKVLASAVANAVHNDALDAEELFVLAAFADGVDSREKMEEFVDNYEGDGITKSYAFDENGDVTLDNVVIWSYKVEGGALVADQEISLQE